MKNTTKSLISKKKNDGVQYTILNVLVWCTVHVPDLQYLVSNVYAMVFLTLILCLRPYNYRCSHAEN